MEPPGPANDDATSKSGSGPNPHDYVVNKSYFKVHPRPTWTWPENGTIEGLRGAIVQHEIVRTINRLRSETAESYERLAARMNLTAGSLAGVLVGSQRLTSFHLGSFLAWTPNVPSTEELRDAMRIVLHLNGLIPDHVLRVIPPGMLDAEQRGGDNVLAALNGTKAGTRTATDRRNDERVARVAGTVLTQAIATRQSRTSNTMQALAVPASGDPMVSIETVVGGEPPLVHAFSTSSGPLVVADLPADWDTRVHQDGWSVVDGHFIVDVVDSDAHGRPSRVLSLRQIGGANTLEPGDGDAEFTTELAIVDWQNDTASMKFCG